MSLTRRQFVGALSAIPIAISLDERIAIAGDQQKGTRLILLGTKGGPRVAPTGRANPGTLLLIKDVPYIVDCGYGTTRQLLNARVSLDRLRYVFISHHHSDHNIEYGPLFYNAWVTGASNRVDSYGPAGLVDMAADFFSYLKIDIATRIRDEGRSDPRKQLVPHEITGGGIVMRNSDVTVTAARVRHPLIKDAYAYRFDAADRSIVISGDTTYSPELVRLAAHADVLVQEVMYVPGVDALAKRLPNATTIRSHLLAAHTTTDDAGKMAAASGVKTLVLTHFVPGDDPSITDEMWAEGVRKHFDGQVIVGKDLMEI